MTLTLTQTEYLKVKALFKCASQDSTRLVLTYVFYNGKKKTFVATDGHVLRFEKFEQGERVFPSENYLFKASDFILTKSQLKAKYFFADVEIDLSTILTDVENPYPNYENVIPLESSGRPLEGVGIGTEALLCLCSTFYSESKKPPILAFRFTGELSAILVYRAPTEKGGKVEFCGVIMPCRIFDADWLQVWEITNLTNFKEATEGKHSRK